MGWPLTSILPATMDVEICYIYPQGGANGHLEKALKFLATYHACPPMALHRTVIVCNETPCNSETEFLFASMPEIRFLNSDGKGKDISGFQKSAQSTSAGLMVFLGGNSYFRRPGWLQRMTSVYQAYGDGLYGCTGNQGDHRFNVWPHARTTGWWARPQLVNEHPLRVTDDSQRYFYEHGADGISSWVIKKGKPVWIVGWNCVYPLHDCDAMPFGYHQGNQENLIVGDRLTAPPYHHCE